MILYLTWNGSSTQIRLFIRDWIFPGTSSLSTTSNFMSLYRPKRGSLKLLSRIPGMDIIWKFFSLCPSPLSSTGLIKLSLKMNWKGLCIAIARIIQTHREFLKWKEIWLNLADIYGKDQNSLQICLLIEILLKD